MKLFRPLSYALLGAAFLVAGCSDDKYNFNTQLRVTHASPDAPTVNVYINGKLELAGVDYKQSSGLLDINDKEVDVEVRGILADGSELSVIGPVTLELTEDTKTDVVAYDNLLDGQAINIKPNVIVSDIVADNSDVLVSVLHAAPAVADVDIYVTSPGDALANYTPIDADFGDSAGPVTLLPNKNYQVRITPDGSDTVVYDSGTLSFPGGTELLLVAVENTTGIGDNPVNLLAVDSSGAQEVFDVATGAEVRVVHNSADTPAVDVLVNGTEVIDALEFPDATAYDEVAAPAGSYNIVVTEDPGNTLTPIDINVDLEQGQSYTAIAIGGLNSITDETLEALLTVDDRRTLATAAKLRVVHGSYAVAENIPVDVYLTDSAVITGATPAIEDLAYGDATDQLQVAAGDYYITVTVANDPTTIAFASGVAITLSADNNYTVIARDPGGAETGAPLILATVLGE